MILDGVEIISTFPHFFFGGLDCIFLFWSTFAEICSLDEHGIDGERLFADGKYRAA